MGIHRLDWPTFAAGGASLIFTYGARLTDDVPTLKLNQSVDTTWGGTTRAKSFGPAKTVYPLTALFPYAHSSEHDWNDVVAFIKTSADGAVDTVEWTDEDGTIRTVRIVNDSFTFPVFGWRDGVLLMSTRFELEVVE